jgi:hypothetical protein
MAYGKPRIKFSHDYFKLKGVNKATLLSVRKVDDLKCLSADFLNYDTKYWNKTKKTSEFYPLEYSKSHLILFFYAEDKSNRSELVGHIFTTIRRWYPQKEAYYNLLIGEEFDVIVGEGE